LDLTQRDAIILTEGEYDAMAVAQSLSTHLPSSDPLAKIPGNCIDINKYHND
jgi:hypothetical protein